MERSHPSGLFIRGYMYSRAEHKSPGPVLDTYRLSVQSFPMFQALWTLATHKLSSTLSCSVVMCFGQSTRWFAPGLEPQLCSSKIQTAHNTMWYLHNGWIRV